ncbi:hypothetical protein WK29_17665 [Burkholderia vietnamiensis]|nr:hypothetical protein WK29_17665 [Burkholderia vietnamiensis]HDR8935716.1 DUF3987 domain-containing protein [Burkholderia vietnamiensis]
MTEENKQDSSWYDAHKKRKEGASSWQAPSDTNDALVMSVDESGKRGEQSGTSAFPYWDEKKEDFPVSKLPEIIKGAVIEVCENDNVPHSVAAQAALSVVAVACQDLIYVERREGLRSVCSLFMLTVADSGARKTRAEEPFTHALRGYDRKMRMDYEKEVEEYDIWLKKRKTEERALVSAYTSLKRKLEMQAARPHGDEKDANANSGQADERSESAAPGEEKRVGKQPHKHEQDLFALLLDTERKLDDVRLQLQSREKPRLKRLLYSHSAVSDLERSLYENWPSAALLSSEGADIVLRRTESDMARLDRLWDGQAIDVIGKRRQENVFVADPRLTMSLMIQPSVFDRFLERKGERARGIGFMPRFLVARPSVAYGERTIDHTAERSTVWLDRFNTRVWQLLQLGQSDFSRRADNRRVLRFSPEAHRR